MDPIRSSLIVPFTALKRISVLIVCVIFSLNLIFTTVHADNPAKHNHANRSEHSIGIGHLCHQHKDCANDSICLRKTFQDHLELKICQCEPDHTNRVDHSCFAKPGHQCYFPEKNIHGRLLLVCMKEAECRSGVNKSAPGNGYCMCTDDPRADIGPFRFLDTENEIRRCSATSLFSFTNFGWIFTMSWSWYLMVV